MNDLKIFAGKSNQKLAGDVVDWIDTNCQIGSAVLGKLDPRRKFSDGELYVRYDESVRDSDVFIVQSTNQPDSNLFELLMMADTARHASARRITAVIPYLGYSRQDWKDKSRAPVAVALIPRLLEASGVNRVLLLDVHSNATLSAFQARGIQVDHLWAKLSFSKYLKANEDLWRSSRNLVVAAPDIHAGKLARAYGKILGATGFVVIEKNRPEPGKAEVLNVIGEAGGCDVLIVDDMIDTAGTNVNAANVLKDRGAENIFTLGTHGVFSGKALDRLQNSVIDKVFVTDSIFQSDTVLSSYPKIQKISLAGLLGEAICRTHKNESVSSLFENE